jgi:hypothetical protein
VRPDATIRRRSRKICALLAGSMLLMVLGSVQGREGLADSQTQAYPQPVTSEPLVIQGRITMIQGALVTVKTPDGYPGGPGIHAHVVIAGPVFEVDVSRARVLLPDGRRADALPLTVGDHVLMVLSAPDSGSTVPGGPGNENQTYFASSIERIVSGDKIITH